MAIFAVILTSAITLIGASPCATGEVCEAAFDDLSLLQAQLKVEHAMGDSKDSQSQSKTELSSLSMVDAVKEALKRTGDEKCQLEETSIMAFQKSIGGLLKGVADPISMMSQLRNVMTAAPNADVDLKHTIDCLHKAAVSMEESDIAGLSSSFVSSAISAVQAQPCLEQYVYPASEKLESAFVQLFGAITSAEDAQSAVENAEDELQSMLHKDESLVNPIQCLLTIGEEESTWLGLETKDMLKILVIVACVCGCLFCLCSLICVDCCIGGCVTILCCCGIAGLIVAFVAWQFFVQANAQLRHKNHSPDAGGSEGPPQIFR